MRQLKYNNDFNKLEEEIPLYKEIKDIPNRIIDTINSIEKKRVVLDELTNIYYCPICFNKLVKDLTCPICNIIYEDKYPIKVYNIAKKLSDTNNYYYYFFEIIGKTVLLYTLKETTYLSNLINYKPSKVTKLEINKIYHIEETKITEILSKTIYTKEEITKTCEKESSSKLEEEFFFPKSNSYLYTDNLIYLKDTIYKYSHIWESTNYLHNNYINLYRLIYLPLYHKEFEYLIKLKLYNLAYSYTKIHYKKNFQKTFGVDKSYLSFMQEIDITPEELNTLKLIKVKDKKLIKVLTEQYYPLEEIYSLCNINIYELMNYMKTNDPDKLWEYLWEYSDYLSMAKEIGLDLKDKKVLFPNNLLASHDELCMQLEIIKDPTIDKRIKEKYKLLEINKYEDKDYIIIPADSIDSLVNESINQNNCVRTYCTSYANNDCQIYFLRKKTEPDKSLVTIEVIDSTVVQAKIKHNKAPSPELMEVINKWEKTIIPIISN